MIAGNAYAYAIATPESPLEKIIFVSIGIILFAGIAYVVFRIFIRL